MSPVLPIWSFLIPGITFGFVAAVQPGPLSIYLISRTLQTGFKKTFPAIFAPLISDGPVAIVCLIILGILPSQFLMYIRLAGGLFLFYLAIRAAISWRKRETVDTSEMSSGRTLFDAVTVNILNPNAYLGWSLVMGPLLLKGWAQSPFYGFSLLICFYVTMIGLTAIILLLFEEAREKVPKIQHILMGLSALFLALFGLWQISSVYNLGIW